MGAVKGGVPLSDRVRACSGERSSELAGEPEVELVKTPDRDGQSCSWTPQRNGFSLRPTLRDLNKGIVRAFLEADFRVVVPSRSEAKIAQLTDRLGDTPGELEPIVIDLEDKEAVQTAVRSKVDGVDALVASLGGWWHGTPLVNVRPETWRKVMSMGLDAHFFFARAFVPLLRRGPGSSYTFINGFSAEQAYPGASLSSISAAAQLMMAQNLMAELKGQHRVNALVLGPVISRSRSHGDHNWITAVDAGNAAVALAKNIGADAEIYRLDTVEDLSKVKRMA